MNTEWYQFSFSKILEILQTSEKGLSSQEVYKRLKQYGKNELPKQKKDNILKTFLRQLLDPIVLILIITAIFSFIIQEYTDAFAILFIILVDLVMGTFQEWKAEKNAEALEKLITVEVSVLRDGKQQEIDSSQLVIGDIVLLESGDQVSADMRLIDSHNLTVDESVLTGESTTVVKSVNIISKTAALAERSNMVFAGTSIITGRAKAIVVSTAIDTELGKIAHHVTSAKATKSPLTIRMEKFSKQICFLVVIVAIIITVLLLFKNTPGDQIFLSVIALSVSAMPEGLPLALTMALTIASNRMAKKNVIVKKLNSVESLGSCTVIASDKTGTLTVNQQTAKKIVLPNGESFDITGVGYHDQGQIIINDALYIEDIQKLCQLGAINNEAHIEKVNNQWITLGDSIDIAFLILEKKAKIEHSQFTTIGSIPYESQNKYSALFYQSENTPYVTVKGSIEKVLEFCTTMNMKDKVTPIDKERLLQQNEKLAQLGYRVIALANGNCCQKATTEEFVESNIHDLTFMGMVAFIDPIREEAKQSIQECKKAGIKVIMITGDHPLTAFAIAKELGLVNSYDEITTGSEIETYLSNKQEFDKFVTEKSVFTRVTPLDKLEIVNAYQRQGQFVAVTGDGVNDAPALRSANIGIAMGSGTDVAKETATMIVIDDDFQSIVAGIKEGRNAYSNIRKVSYLLLSCGLAEILFFILSILFNLPMPLIAIQLLWLNIVTNGLQDLALSFEKAEKNIMEEKPRNTKESIFNGSLLKEVILSGMVIGLLVFGVWIYLLHVKHLDVSVARGYVMVLMVFIQNIHVLNCRSETQSTFKISLRSNPLIMVTILSSILLQIMVIEIPVFSTFLQTSSIPFIEVIKLLGLSFLILLVMEGYKFIIRKKKKS